MILLTLQDLPRFWIVCDCNVVVFRDKDGNYPCPNEDCQVCW